MTPPQRAIQEPDFCERLVAIFNDKDENNSRSLEAAVRALPGIEKLKHSPEIYTGGRRGKGDREDEKVSGSFLGLSWALISYWRWSSITEPTASAGPGASTASPALTTHPAPCRRATSFGKRGRNG
jgi:hypothetical protein